MTQEKDPKEDRSRREEAQDPNRTGGLGSRREEAPGQNKPPKEEKPEEGETEEGDPTAPA